MHIFASMFMKIIDLQFSFLIMSLLDFCIKIMEVSSNELGSVPSSLFSGGKQQFYRDEKWGLLRGLECV